MYKNCLLIFLLFSPFLHAGKNDDPLKHREVQRSDMSETPEMHSADQDEERDDYYDPYGSNWDVDCCPLPGCGVCLGILFLLWMGMSSEKSTQ